jgi:hypothetical protein
VWIGHQVPDDSGAQRSKVEIMRGDYDVVRSTHHDVFDTYNVAGR